MEPMHHLAARITDGLGHDSLAFSALPDAPIRQLRRSRSRQAGRWLLATARRGVRAGRIGWTNAGSAPTPHPTRPCPGEPTANPT